MSDRSSTRRNWLWRNRRHTCHWCGKRLHWNGKDALTADHVIPLSGAGTNKRTNLVASCYECNQAKRAMNPDDFAKIMEVAMTERAAFRNQEAKHR